MSAAQPNRTWVQDLVASYFDAWNHQEVDAVAKFFTRQGEYIDIPRCSAYSGESLIDYLSREFETSDYHYGVVGDILISDETIAFQYEESVSGQKPEYPVGAEFWRVQDNKLVRLEDHYRTTVNAQVHSSRSRVGKYEKSGLQASDAARYRERLEHLMEVEELFLDANLNLPGLAQAVDCSVNHLSQVINGEFGMSFFEYLNRHRVSAAREILIADPTSLILDIGMQVGFNSSSTFYSAFKKAYNESPADFRRKRLQD